MTAPLTLRRANKTGVIAELFPHPQGLVVFDLYWHLGDPRQTIHVLTGDLRGDGPWKIGEAIVYVLGCQGTDPALVSEYAAWRRYLETTSDYPPPPLIAAIARRFGAITS